MNDNAKKWVAALRTGSYKQCKGALHRIEDGKHSFCCLGVACRLYIEDGNDLPTYSTHRHPSSIVAMSQESYDGSSAILPPQVQRWLGLRGCTGAYWLGLRGCTGAYNSPDASLASDNDLGASFSKIADTIESEPKGLFNES